MVAPRPASAAGPRRRPSATTAIAKRSQPDQHRAPLPVGELVLEAGLGARVVRENDPVPWIELGVVGDSGNSSVMVSPLSGPWWSPNPELVTADVVGLVVPSHGFVSFGPPRPRTRRWQA